MTQDATIKDFNIAINFKELTSALNIATNHLSLGSKNFKEISVKLDDVSTILEGIEPTTRYRKLTDDQKQAIQDLKPILREAMSYSRKGEKSKDTGMQKYAKDIAEDIKRVSARLVAYNHSQHQGSYTNPGLGSDEINKVVLDEAKTISASNAEIAKIFATSASIMDSYRAPKPADPVVIDEVPKVEAQEGRLDKFPIDLFNRTLTGISVGFATFTSAIGEFAKGLSEAYSEMMEGFGEILDSPLEGAITIMRGMTTLLNAGLNMLTGIIDTVTSFISTLFNGPEGSKSNKSKAGNMLTIGATIVNTILGAVASIINIAMQAIQAGFNIFASTLTAVFKLVKKIADTSPVIRAIMEMLNLAFTLFFMPFMNSFALVLLPYVLDLLNWAVSIGEKYSALGETLGQKFVDIVFNDKELAKKVQEIAKSFVEEFLPAFLVDVVPNLLDFALDFADTIVKNKDLIILFLNQGISAFSAMIDNGILKLFLTFGKDVMAWMANNAKTIVDFSTSILGGLLKIAKIFMGIVGGSDTTGDITTAVEDIEIIEKSLDESGIYTDLKDIGTALDNTNLEAVEEIENPLLDTPKTIAGDNAALGGGLPPVADTGSEGLSDEEIENISKDTRIIINTPGDILSKDGLRKDIRKNADRMSRASLYKG